MSRHALAILQAAFIVVSSSLVAVFAIPILGEHISLRDGVAIAVVIASLALTQIRRRSRARA